MITARSIYRMRTVDFLSVGVVLGEIAFLFDLLCSYLASGGLHGVPSHLKLWGCKASYYPGMLALAMLVFGKRDVLEQRHANKQWVRSVLFARWGLMLYWIVQLIIGVTATVVLLHVRGIL